MKILTLELKKTVLIVDAPIDTKGTEVINQSGETISINFYKNKDTFEPLHISEPGKWKLLCQGTPTEEQASELVDTDVDVWSVDWFRDYTVIDTKLHDAFVFLTAEESFISAIYAQGYYWFDSPIRKPEYEIEWYGKSPSEFKRYESDMQKFQDFESHTFKNPIIFIKY